MRGMCPTGHLLYVVGSTLLAVPFNVATFAVRAGAVSLVQDVALAPDGIMAYFTVSNDGALVYVPTDAVGGYRHRTLVWVDRQGQSCRSKERPLGHIFLLDSRRTGPALRSMSVMKGTTSGFGM